MIEEIQAMWPQINNKLSFIREFAPIIGRTPSYLRNHWFGMFWAIPEKSQEETRDYMKEYIKRQ